MRLTVLTRVSPPDLSSDISLFAADLSARDRLGLAELAGLRRLDILRFIIAFIGFSAAGKSIG
jgi:hypothetical protein